MASSVEVLNLAQLAFFNNKPTATLYQSSGTSIANNPSPYQVVGFNASTEDNWSGHSSVTNNSRYTVQVAGTYRVSGAVQFPTNGTGIRGVEIFKNGTSQNGVNQLSPSNSSTFTSVPVPASNIACVVGDYIEIAAYQNSGGALTTQGNGTFLSVEFLHS